jgi:hypothetical protein
MKDKLLGFGSIFCPAYVVLACMTAVLLPLFVDMGEEIPRTLIPVFVLFMILLVTAVLGSWFFIIYYIIHVVRNPAFSGGRKAGWICALWFLNVFAIPWYWMKHLRGHHRAVPPIEPHSSTGTVS